MKTIIIILSIVLSSFFIQAQTVKKDSAGNYVSVSKASVNKDTGKTFTTSKGEVFKVYESAKGKLYVIRKSKKTNTEYKQYLTVN